MLYKEAIDVFNEHQAELATPGSPPAAGSYTGAMESIALALQMTLAAEGIPSDIEEIARWVARHGPFTGSDPNGHAKDYQSVAGHPPDYTASPLRPGGPAGSTPPAVPA